MALNFVIVVPPASSHDVEKREISVQIGERPISNLSIDISTNETSKLSGENGDVVKGSLVDFRDGGKAGEPRHFKVVLKDSVLATKRGEIGLKLLNIVQHDEQSSPSIPSADAVNESTRSV